MVVRPDPFEPEGERSDLGPGDSMFTVPQLRELYRHMEWADARIWRVALAHDAVASDERLHALLHHLHATQRAFLHAWTDQPLVWREVHTFATLEELLAWARSYYGEVGRRLEQLDNTRLALPLIVPWAEHFTSYLGRRPDTTTLAETMFQVTSHSTYHRAQVNTRLRELGAEPALVDYIAWIWSGRPAAAWE